MSADSEVMSLNEFHTFSQARLVQELIRAFYVSAEDYQMVHAFNHSPSKFDFNALLKRLGHKLPE